MSTHIICFHEEIEKYKICLVEKKNNNALSSAMHVHRGNRNTL